MSSMNTIMPTAIDHNGGIVIISSVLPLFPVPLLVRFPLLSPRLSSSLTLFIILFPLPHPRSLPLFSSVSSPLPFSSLDSFQIVALLLLILSSTSSSFLRLQISIPCRHFLLPSSPQFKFSYSSFTYYRPYQKIDMYF